MLKRFVVCAVAIAVVGFAFNAYGEKDKKFGAVCPVSGKPAKQEASADYKDGKVYFCCPGCPKAFKANTAKFAAKANHQMVATGQAKQVKCPIAGRPIKDAQSVTVNGVKVGFCCPNCKGKVAKAEGDAQINLVFSDKAFAKGFASKKKKK